MWICRRDSASLMTIFVMWTKEKCNMDKRPMVYSVTKNCPDPLISYNLVPQRLETGQDIVKQWRRSGHGRAAWKRLVQLRCLQKVPEVPHLKSEARHFPIK